MSIESIMRELMIDIGGYDIYPDEVERRKQPASYILNEDELFGSFIMMMTSIQHNPCKDEIQMFLAKLPEKRRILNYKSYLVQVIENEYEIDIDYDIDYDSIIDCIIQLSQLYKEYNFGVDGTDIPIYIVDSFYDDDFIEGVREKNKKLYVCEGGCMRIFERNKLKEIRVEIRKNPDYEQYDRFRYKNGKYQIETYDDNEELIFVDI